MRVLAMLRKSYANSSIRHLPARSNANETSNLKTHHSPTHQQPPTFTNPLATGPPTYRSSAPQAKMNAHCHPESKSNALLTPSEREAKKRLKGELKFQRKVKKLETRIKHAISRNDPVIEQSTREELEDLLSKKAGDENDSQLQRRPQLSLSLCESSPSNNVEGQAALDEVLAILLRLLSSDNDDDKDKVHDEKVKQTKTARHLLRNMTKGTQSKSMFQDVTALRGYVRQKFHGRAALIIESLGKLSPKSLEVATSSIYSHIDIDQQHEHEQQIEIMNMCWEKLGTVEKVCSLGCGPGNDAVGLIVFLRNYFHRKEEDGIKEAFMLDYAISEWKGAVLDDLIPILEPEYKVSCESCDVTKPIGNDSTIEQFVKDSDIFLTSYVLTETRNLWGQFIVRLVEVAKVGALLNFAEPVPWQLHRLIRMAAGPEPFLSDASPEINFSPLQRLRFVWIDTSMHFPDLQKLDGRSGPAVLLAIKV